MNKTKLNVYLAHAGLCSRRKADELIKQGHITINHAVEKRPSYTVREKDTVRYQKQVVKLGNIPFVTIVVNKPTNVITTVSDAEHRQTIISIIEKKVKHRVYPIGRLDRNTTGVILLTNDGELAQKLAHPKYEIEKTYQVTLNKDLTTEHLDKIKKGLQLKDGAIQVDSISRALNKRNIRVSLHSGRNRIVRRIFEALGYTVRKLDRTSFAGFNKKNLELGEFRYLRSTQTDRFKNMTAKELSKSEIIKIQRSKPLALESVTSKRPKKVKAFTFESKYGKPSAADETRREERRKAFSEKQKAPREPKPFETPTYENSSDDSFPYWLEK